MSEFFYTPEVGWPGDFIPFYKDGLYYLYYLKDYRDQENHGEGTPWFLITTADFAHFQEHGEVIPRGAAEQQDLFIFTGCVLEAAGKFHIFYTGHNPHFAKLSQPVQGVMHAVSDDLIHWTKVPEDTFFAPTDRYEANDWRDPFVFWNEAAGEYQMLLAARHLTGMERRRGLTALCASKDLKAWEVRDDFYAPALYHTHECPDLFQMGDWHYLVFSEYSDEITTRYRMSRSLSGPWMTPPDDCFDGIAYYAAKSASDGDRRFLFGWNPTREGDRDTGVFQWGGSLVAHEIFQRADGTLGVRPPESVTAAFSVPQTVKLQSVVGDCRCAANEAHILGSGTFAAATAGSLPEHCKITATLEFASPTRDFGLMLRAYDDFEQGYSIRLKTARQTLCFETLFGMFPRTGNVPRMTGLERPLAMTPGQAIELTVFVSGTICEVYADGQIALSARMYNLPTGNWGVFVTEGEATFRSVTLQTLPPQT